MGFLSGWGFAQLGFVRVGFCLMGFSGWSFVLDSLSIGGQGSKIQITPPDYRTGILNWNCLLKI